jgi:iron-sulfur cluster repair protein YtfE (RIC family)
MNGAREILESDHAELDRLLEKVQQSLADDDMYQPYAVLDLFWARLAVHIRAEHLHLFSELLRASRSSREMDETIRQLRKDHDSFMTELGSLIKAFRTTSGSDAAEVLKSARPRIANLAGRLEEHNKVEESRIYPLVSELGHTQAEHLRRNVEKELNSLPHRFSVLNPD